MAADRLESRDFCPEVDRNPAAVKVQKPITLAQYMGSAVEMIGATLIAKSGLDSFFKPADFEPSDGLSDEDAKRVKRENDQILNDPRPVSELIDQ